MKACGGWIPQELVTLAGPTRRGVDAAMDASGRSVSGRLLGQLRARPDRARRPGRLRVGRGGHSARRPGRGPGTSCVVPRAGIRARSARPGLGRIREAAVRALRPLRPLPDVVLLDATGRDQPRRAGLAQHLGAALELPGVGVSHRPLLAHGDWPVDEASAAGPLFLHGAVVGFWLRTRAGMRPIAVPAAPSTRRAVGACHRRRGPVDLLSSGLPGG